MGNRTHPNVIKVRKQKRNGRRAYLTPIFGLIKVTRSVGKSDVPDKMRALFDYRARGKFDASEVPSSKMLSAERMQAIRRMQEQGKIPDHLEITVRRGGITKTVTKFCFQSDFRICFWIKEDFLNMVVYKSQEYHGEGAKNRAYFDLEHDRIPWMESCPIEAALRPG